MRLLSCLVLVVLLVLAACDRTPEAPPAEEQQRRAQADTPAAPILRYAEGVRDDTSKELARRVRGQVVYAPVYSHIFFRDARRTIDLAATLSIRNTSLSDTLAITKVDYYDSNGALVRRHLEQPRRLVPLASTYFVVEEADRTGGVGANYIVEWRAGQPITAPVIETVMISTASSQGISLTSPGRVLRAW